MRPGIYLDRRIVTEHSKLLGIEIDSENVPLLLYVSPVFPNGAWISKVKSLSAVADKCSLTIENALSPYPGSAALNNYYILLHSSLPVASIEVIQQ